MTVAGNVQCNMSLDSQSSEKFLNCFKAHSALINSNTHPPVSLQGLFHSKAAYFLPVLSALLLICFCFKWTHAFVIVYFLFFSFFRCGTASKGVRVNSSVFFPTVAETVSISGRSYSLHSLTDIF